MAIEKTTARVPLWVSGLFPLLLLAGLVTLFYVVGPAGVFRAAFPPIEELTIERFELRPNEVLVHVVNGGPQAVTVAQVMVDEAYWDHRIDPDRTIPRLGRATVSLPYPWVEGEAHEITLVTSTGLTFSKEIEVATQTPTADWRYITTFALLGFYAGVVPVFLGLLWFPFLGRLSERWIDFFLSVTVGLLIFLGVDALAEALETAESVPSAFQGIGLITVGVLVSFLGVTAAGNALRARRHGASVGEIALGTFLVIGFTLHNTTEGLAIIAPIAKTGASVRSLALLGLVAGAPTIAGAWIGGFSYSPLLATLFLAIGAGAIFQVVYIVGRQMMSDTRFALATGWNFAGLVLGLLLMYGTALLVVA
jgi:ZIP family zinc transporter